MKSSLSLAMSTWMSSLAVGQAASAPAEPQPSAATRPVERTKSAQPAAAVLTPREIDVLRLLAADCTCAQAAARLGISPHTVITHVKNMYRKLEVHSAAAAVMRAIQIGLLLG